MYPSNRLYHLGLIVALSACVGADQPAEESSADADRAAIIEASDAFMRAHEEGDAAAVVQMFTTDGRLMAPGAEDAEGREALLQMAEGFFASVDIRDFELVSRELTIHGDAAYELASYTETLQSAGEAPASVAGRYLIVWHRQPDGSWKVHRNMFNFTTSM